MSTSLESEPPKHKPLEDFICYNDNHIPNGVSVDVVCKEHGVVGSVFDEFNTGKDFFGRLDNVAKNHLLQFHPL